MSLQKPNHIDQNVLYFSPADIHFLLPQVSSGFLTLGRTLSRFAACVKPGPQRQAGCCFVVMMMKTASSA